MTSEDQEILAQISQLAGQINRHKNQQQPGAFSSTQHTESVSQYHPNTCMKPTPQQPNDTLNTDLHEDPTSASTGWRPSRGAYPGRYPRGGRKPQIHRNKTLVLNGGVNTPSTTDNMNDKSEDEPSSTPATSSTPAWVTKTDRHLQLINPAIFEKQSQQRAKAMEATRKLKLKQRDERERIKISKHLKRLEDPSSAGVAASHASVGSTHHEITVQGIRFRVVKNGSKLMKVPGENLVEEYSTTYGRTLAVFGLRIAGDENAAKATPKTATIGGVRFYRSKNGNLYRSGIVRAHRYDPPNMRLTLKVPLSGLETELTLSMAEGPVWLKESMSLAGHFPRRVAFFSSNATSFLFSNKLEVSSHGIIADFVLGTCLKGPKCRYIHDPSKVAICKDFLKKGSCTLGDSCDLSHDLTPERTPACLHFVKGNCSNPSCRYSHVRVSPSAPVCRPFGIYGYCEQGANCEDRHVHECPDFSNTGVCNTKGCKLLHKHKASVIRKNAVRGDQPEEDGSSDLSSDEDEDEIDSDDVDSDDLNEEYFGDGDGEKDADIPLQQDFVQL